MALEAQTLTITLYVWTALIDRDDMVQLNRNTYLGGSLLLATDAQRMLSEVRGSNTLKRSPAYTFVGTHQRRYRPSSCRNTLQLPSLLFKPGLSNPG